MTVIETHTTHTAVLEWPYKKPLSKDELIHKLTITIPSSADIVGMAIADVPRKYPKESFPIVMRTLTITYRDDPFTARCRRP